MVWQDNRALPWKRLKSLSVPYLNLPLALQDSILLLCFLLWFGFASPVSPVERSQLKAWLKSVFARVTTVKSRGGGFSRAQPGGSCGFLGAAQGPKDGAPVHWLWIRSLVS